MHVILDDSEALLGCFLMEYPIILDYKNAFAMSTHHLTCIFLVFDLVDSDYFALDSCRVEQL